MRLELLLVRPLRHCRFWAFRWLLTPKDVFFSPQGTTAFTCIGWTPRPAATRRYPGSPFASANTNGPILIATEPTGTYLGVVNATGLNPGESSVESFQIDSTGEALISVPGSFLELVSSPIGAAGNPALGTFYVYLGPNSVTTDPAYQQDGELLVYTIDPQTGLLGTETGADGSTSRGRSFAADPLGRFVVTGQGKQTGSLEVTPAAGAEGAFTIGSSIFPQEIFVAPGEHFVYVTLFAGNNSVVHIYILDTTTWELSEAPSSPLPGFASIADFVADPTGPFVYESTAPNQVRVYSVDPSTGYFAESHRFAFFGSWVWIAGGVQRGRGRDSAGGGTGGDVHANEFVAGQHSRGHAKRRAEHPAIEYRRSSA